MARDLHVAAQPEHRAHAQSVQPEPDVARFGGEKCSGGEGAGWHGVCRAELCCHLSTQFHKGGELYSQTCERIVF